VQARYGRAFTNAGCAAAHAAVVGSYDPDEPAISGTGGAPRVRPCRSCFNEGAFAAT